MKREDLEPLERLRSLLRRRDALASWSAEELLAFPRLYRRACSIVARLESRGEDPSLARAARGLVARAHALLHHDHEGRQANLFVRIYELFLSRSPRAIRAEWKLGLTSLVLLYGLAAVAWFAVSRDLDLAPSLLQPQIVEGEIAQLRSGERGEPFRGNFTFGWGESPTTAGMVMLNNMGVGILFFASALVPPLYLYLLTVNALMLGTYTAVAGHWGQAGAISSILWCHGTLEIQAIVLAGTAGLVLVRAWIRPGPWTRRHALVRESKQALLLLAPVFPMLFFAGLIEGFVSPHASFPARVAVGAATGVGLLVWVFYAGRGLKTNSNSSGAPNAFRPQ